MISVIIPTCNRNDLLSNCLQLISPVNQTMKEAYEVIVTDDSKDNNAKTLIEENFTWVRWIDGPKRGPAANRNNGAKVASGDWFVFIDDDCLPDKNLLLEYQIEFQRNEKLAYEGKIISDRPKQSFDEHSPINLGGGNFWSCNIAIKDALFWELNGFDENFPYAYLEDTDMFERIKKLTTTCFLPNALVIHPFYKRGKSFMNYNKWIISSKYMIKKEGRKTNFNFRIQRLKLFINFIIVASKELYNYKFLGYKFYLEQLLYFFLMIFLKAD